jgi:tetratricopeptide (TPR) repeat protein
MNPALPPRPPSKHHWGTWVLSISLFLGALLELLNALVTAGDLGTHYQLPGDRYLVWSQVGGAGVVLFAALAVTLRKKLPWKAVLTLQLLAAAVQILPIRATMAAIDEAVHRGGDWAGLAVLTRQASLMLEFGVTGICLVSVAYGFYRRRPNGSIPPEPPPPAKVLLLLTLTACILRSATAQEAGRAGEVQALEGRQMLTSISILPRTDAPFTLTLRTEWERTLPNGRTTTVWSQRLIARDRSGRVFQERRSFVPIDGRGDPQLRQIEISNPTTHEKYFCNPRTQNCALRVYTEKSSDPAGVAAGDNPDNSTQGKNLRHKAIHDIDTIEIVEPANPAQGSAGKHEEWYSPKLGIPMLVKHSDPRFGSTTFTVTEIKLGDPAPAYFSVPAGYSVVDRRSAGSDLAAANGAGASAQPGDAASHYSLANDLFAQGKVDAAIKEYRAALRMDAGNADIHIDFGIALSAKGDYDQAVKEFSEALKLKPGDTEIHFYLGNALSGKGDLDGAIKEYGEALRLKASNPEVHFNLGNALYGKGDMDGAIKEFGEFLRLKPDDAEAHLNIGNAIYAKGDPEGALKEYREALRLKPYYAEAQFGIANVLVMKHDVDEAIKLYQEGLQKKPEDAEAHFNLGNALEQMGRHTEAVTECNMARTLQSGDQDMGDCPIPPAGRKGNAAH